MDPRNFLALGAEPRLEILQSLIRRGAEGAPAGEISAELGIAPPTLSFHLKELKNANLVSARRQGRRIHYAPDYSGIRRLVDCLLLEICQADPRLCGPYVVREPAL